MTCSRNCASNHTPALHFAKFAVRNCAVVTREIEESQTTLSIREKVRAYAEFGKLRLSSLVVFSAIISYLLATQAGGTFSWIEFAALFIGGFLVTASSNGFNQVIERDLDKIMNRTKDRPIPTGRMTAKEGIVVASVFGLIGLAVLWIYLNPLSFVLGLLALFSYVALYTPLKRISPFAVMVGAFPGAIPPMLGYIAETGEFGLIPGILFAVQFIWQFPHFWAIAWKAHDDYQKAGFHLLPSPGGRDKQSAFQIMLYSFFMIPASALPYMFGITGSISLYICLTLSVLFFWTSIELYKKCDMPSAKRIMFASFAWLPLVQLSFLI